MDNNRTFGIEIECVSREKDRWELARLIQSSLQANGFPDHRCVATGYSHSTNQLNKTVWEVKTDTSLSVSPEQYTRGFRFCVEVVSPVLQGPEGLRALKMVCDAIAPYTTTNKSCGLHVHHGISGVRDATMVGTSWLMAEQIMFESLPASRWNNKYCMPMTPKLRWNGRISVINDAFRTRYWSLNLVSVAMRNTVEFRCAAGTVEYEKISNWMLITQAFVNAAIATEFDECPTIERLIDRIIGNHVISPYNRSKAAAVLNPLVAEGRWTLQEIVNRALEIEPNFSAATYGGYLTAGFNVEGNLLAGVCSRNVPKGSRWNKGIVKFERLFCENTNAEIDPDYKAAGEWLKGRHAKFVNARDRR